VETVEKKHTGNNEANYYLSVTMKIIYLKFIKSHRATRKILHAFDPLTIPM
jgi:hypothetical protein